MCAFLQNQKLLWMKKEQCTCAQTTMTIHANGLNKVLDCQKCPISKACFLQNIYPQSQLTINEFPAFRNSQTAESIQPRPNCPGDTSKFKRWHEAWQIGAANETNCSILCRRPTTQLLWKSVSRGRMSYREAFDLVSLSVCCRRVYLWPTVDPHRLHNTRPVYSIHRNVSHVHASSPTQPTSRMRFCSWTIDQGPDLQNTLPFLIRLS